MKGPDAFILQLVCIALLLENGLTSSLMCLTIDVVAAIYAWRLFLTILAGASGPSSKSLVLFCTSGPGASREL